MDHAARRFTLSRPGLIRCPATRVSSKLALAGISLLGAGNVTGVAAVNAKNLGMEVTLFPSWAAFKEFGIDYRTSYDIDSNSSLTHSIALVSTSALKAYSPAGASRDVLHQ
jgi:hypothetical protein